MEAENFFIWLTNPGGAMLTTSQHRQQQNTKMRVVLPGLPHTLDMAPPRNILDEDSVYTHITVPISSNFDEVDHQLHPSHVPTPQTLQEFESEVHPVATSVLENALGGIQQSLQSLLEKGSGKENNNQNSKLKFKHNPSPPESPISTTTKKSTIFSLVDGMKPTRMGPEFWKMKATPPLLGGGSRHEREEMTVTIISPPDSPTGNIRSVTTNSNNDPNSGIEVAVVDFERFIDEMEARDDDTTMEEMTLYRGIQNNPFLIVDANINTPLTITARTTSPPPLQQQWLSDHSLNLHQSCRPSIRWLDEDIKPVLRSLDAVGRCKNDEEKNE